MRARHKLIRHGEVADIRRWRENAGVSRARVSNVVSLIGTAAPEQEQLADMARLNH